MDHAKLTNQHGINKTHQMMTLILQPRIQGGIEYVKSVLSVVFLKPIKIVTLVTYSIRIRLYRQF